MISVDTVNKWAKELKLDISKYKMDQIRNGIEVEREHDSGEYDVVGKEKDLLKIALVHLDELPDYYDRLKKMEERTIRLIDLLPGCVEIK